VKIKGFFLVFLGCYLIGCADEDSGSNQDLLPENVQVETESNRVRISWDYPGSASSYRVYKIPALDSPLEDARKFFDTRGHSIVVEDLDNFQGYYFAVVGHRGIIGSSPEVRVAAMPEPPFEANEVINPTGIRKCFDGESGGMVECPVAEWPGQDGDYAVAGETGDFSFTKIAANGATLPDDAEEWSCVRDDNTGLMWEVKIPLEEKHFSDMPLQSIHARFTRYLPDERINHGSPGRILDNSNGEFSCPLEECSTWHYLQVINEKALCGYNDWRLPTVTEMHHLRDHTPTAACPQCLGEWSAYIDTDFFPGRGNHPDFAREYSTLNALVSKQAPEQPNADANDEGRFWIWSDPLGAAYTNSTYSINFLKLVRDAGGSSPMDLVDTLPPEAVGGQVCHADVLGSHKPDDFLINNDGTVTHEATGLIWMQCALGQEWDDGECVGDPNPLPVQKALQQTEHFEFAGYDDWRLPNYKELETLTERACREPAIDRNIFPNHPSRGISLSSTPVFGREDTNIDSLFRGYFYGVDFLLGSGIHINSDQEEIREDIAKRLMVRLVRRSD